MTFDHLRFTETYDPGQAFSLDPGAHDITISNCEFFGAHGQGIMGNASYMTIVRNLVHDNGNHDNKDHGIYVEGAHNIVRGNIVYNNWMFGIHVYNGSTNPGGYNLIENNVVYHNGWGAKAAIGTTQTAGVILSSNHPSNTVRNNILCDNADYAIYVEQWQPSNVVTGNVSCYNHTAGYYFPGPGNGDTLTNNISYNDYNTALIGGSPLVSDNNTYWKTGGTPTMSWNGTSYSSLSSFQSATGQDVHSKILDPQFKNVPSSGFDWTQMKSYNFCTPLNSAFCTQ
jgi:parallel beta-helix repeat protein